MSHPDQPPKFFVDRSLGRIAVPRLLREAAWDLITLAEHYGVPEDERVADVDWIEEAAAQGWPVLMKDKKIRPPVTPRLPIGRASRDSIGHRAEIAAVVEHKARCFVITRGDLASAQYAERFIANHEAIVRTAATPGPFIVAVHTDRLERLYPKT